MTSLTRLKIPESTFFPPFFEQVFSTFEHFLGTSFSTVGLLKFVLFVTDLLICEGCEFCSFFFPHSALRSLAVLTAPKNGGFKFCWVLNRLNLTYGDSLNRLSILDVLVFLTDS